MILSQFQSVGRDLFSLGLVPSYSGNLSIRLGERIIITRRNSRLGRLEEQDLVETGIIENDRYTPLASRELAVHRAAYQQTSASAIVHAHPPYAIALSLMEPMITPSDIDGLFIGEQIPVLAWNTEVQPGGMADEIAQALKKHKIVMVYGHGSFAIGQILEEACNYTTALEASCKVTCLLKSLGFKPKE